MASNSKYITASSEIKLSGHIPWFGLKHPQSLLVEIRMWPITAEPFQNNL